MKQLMNCYRSTPIANASKITVSLEYYCLLNMSRLIEANISISSRLEVIGGIRSLIKADF
jgi:hypothetical protein